MDKRREEKMPEPSRRRRQYGRKQRKRRGRSQLTGRLPFLILGLAVLFLLGVLVFRACGSGRKSARAEGGEKTGAETAEETAVIPAPDADAVIAFSGDIMLTDKLHKDARDTALTEDDQSITWTYAGTSLQEADYLVGNMETTLAGQFNGWPYYSADDGFAVTLKSVGFDLLTTANNHIMDKGFDALIRTSDVLDRVGLAHMGSYRTQEELDSTHGVLTADINGITVTFLDYTYGSNKEWKERPYALSCFNRTNKLQGDLDVDVEGISERMAYARSLHSDLIIVLIHWGVEYKTVANEGQQQIADLFLQQGADAVMGNHSHVPQNMEYRTVTDGNGQERTGFVCYSLGNHISDFKDKNTYLTAVVNLHVHREAGSTVIQSIDYTPMFMLKAKGQEAGYYLLDSKAVLEDYNNGNTAGLLDEKSAAKVEQGVTDLANILGTQWPVRPTGSLRSSVGG